MLYFYNSRNLVYFSRIMRKFTRSNINDWQWRKRKVEFTKLKNLKFYDPITKGYKENINDQYLYLKVSRSKFVVLVLYIDDILFVNSNFSLLHEIKIFFSKNFKLVDMNKITYVIDINIFRDRS